MGLCDLTARLFVYLLGPGEWQTRFHDRMFRFFKKVRSFDRLAMLDINNFLHFRKFLSFL